MRRFLGVVAAIVTVSHVALPALAASALCCADDHAEAAAPCCPDMAPGAMCPMHRVADGADGSTPAPGRSFECACGPDLRQLATLLGTGAPVAESPVVGDLGRITTGAVRAPLEVASRTPVPPVPPPRV
jgi:hypothetical protein